MVTSTYDLHSAAFALFVGFFVDYEKTTHLYIGIALVIGYLLYNKSTYDTFIACLLYYCFGVMVHPIFKTLYNYNPNQCTYNMKLTIPKNVTKEKRNDFKKMAYMMVDSLYDACGSNNDNYIRSIKYYDYYI